MKKLIHGLLALTLLVAAPLALSQVTQSGNIFGKVTDEQGQGLPGVGVTLSGHGAPQSTVTNVAGEYRFLNLSPGSDFVLTHSLQGFSSVTRSNVIVNVGKNTELTIQLKLSTVQAQVTVSGETPLLDTRRATTGATISKVELESIPSARDPWVVMSTVPGVLMDRVNVGGDQSGQQSGMTNKGTSAFQVVWNVDGVNLTDMASLSSANYYDFDSFEEINVSTGGSDPSIQTPGVQMNLVTKRGTNDVHGGAHTLVTDHRWSATNTPEEVAREYTYPLSNQITGIQEYGADVGGPIVKDRLWLWGSYGRQQIDLLVIGGAADKTTLENINAKLNGQITDSNAATIFFQRGDKIKTGRNVGATRPPETGWNQAGPGMVYKIEDSHIFSSSLFATASASYVDAGFGLISAGRAPTYLDENGIWHGSYYDVGTSRPQTQLGANVSGFFRTGDIGHELKVGFSYRKTPVASNTSWPAGYFACAAGTCVDQASVNVTRDGLTQSRQFYYAGFVSDTLTVKNLTVNVGVRYDHQEGYNDALNIPGSRVPSSLVPTAQNPLAQPLTVPRTESVIWKDWEPRLGLTYALGSDQKTLVRASYARFSDQLGAAVPTYNALAPGLQGIYYAWNDTNNNLRVDPGEVDTSQVLSFYGVDPDNPYSASSPNKLDPNLKAPKTDEFMLGFEREVMPALAVSLNGSYRHYTDFVWRPGIGLTAADYVQAGTLSGHLPDGTAYSVPYYKILAGRAPIGRYETNRSDYDQNYMGLELQVTKRFADKWMARAGFMFSNWKQNVGSGAIVDPTDLLPGSQSTATNSSSGGSVADGGQVVYYGGNQSGSKASVFINAKWNLNINALYALPLGFNVAGNFFARQGYPIIYYQRSPSTGGFEGTKNVLIGAVGDYRLPTVTDLDLRLEKVIKVASLDVTLGVDVFNVFNSNTTLQRQGRIGIGTTNYIQENQSPRVVRFGGRLTF